MLIWIKSFGRCISMPHQKLASHMDRPHGRCKVKRYELAPASSAHNLLGMHAGHKVKLTGLLVPDQVLLTNSYAQTPKHSILVTLLFMQKAWFSVWRYCIGDILCHSQDREACKYELNHCEWESEKDCLLENITISKLLLNDGESSGLCVMSFSIVLPSHLPFFSTPHSGTARWHIMEYFTGCERYYCFPCHLSHCTVQARI